MRKRQIDGFFRELDRELGVDGQIILVGASAGSLMGHIRPSVDIDFEIRLKGRRSASKAEALDRSIRKVAEKMGVAVNYSQNVSRWSMINFMDYRKTALSYKVFGKLTVKLIAPEYWTIGKMGRFIRTDMTDIQKIIRIKKLKASSLIKIWARALKHSELSLELGQYRRHVEFFLARYGPRLWEKSFDAEKAIRLFRKLAGIPGDIQKP